MAVATSEPYDALYNTTHTASDGYGGSLQVSVDERLASRPNQLVAGASYDGSHVGFGQRAELGRLTPERGVKGAGVFLEGAGFRTALAVENQALGIYATDTFTLADPFALNVSARFNWIDTELEDRLGDALTGSHTFARVNPALGFTYTPIAALTAFVGYGESNRAPSAAELACADPGQPCRVPNAFIADPPLRQVVSRSVELGLRGHAGSRRRPWLEGSLAGFGARNSDDILFVAGSHVGTGYFGNAGTTQRIGLELSLAGHLGRLFEWYAAYTLLRATFESPLELPGDANPGAHLSGSDGARVIDVEKGDRIPGLPVHSAKVGVTLAPLDRLELGISAIAHSSQPYRGDEANLLGPVAGYVVLNAQASYRVFDPMTLLVKAQNLLDHRYETFGVLANPSEVLPSASNPRFLTPGAPLGVWAGIIVSER
jgi:outer membrane receptor protein involved in Fe transport